MAIETEDNIETFTGNASTVTAYVIPFTFTAAADLVVTRIAADGTRTLLTLTTDYTVSGQNLLTVVAVPVTEDLEVERATPATNDLESESPPASYATAIERNLDNLTRSVQDAKATAALNLSRSLRVPRGETLAELATAASRAGKLVYFNASTGANELLTPAALFALTDGGVAFTVGTVSTGAAGSSAAVTITGTAPDLVLNLTIPQGIQGVPGEVQGDGAGIDEPEAFRTALGLESCVQLPRLASRLQSSGAINPSILLCGDSVIEGKSESVLDELERRFGGIQSQAIWNNGGNPTAGASLVTSSYSFWPTGEYFSVPTSGVVEFKRNGTSQLRCNQAKIYFIKESGAGTFKIQGSYNGGTYADIGSTIDASNGSTIGAVTSVTLPLGLNSVRVVGVSGTVKILPICRYQVTGGAGIQVSSLFKGGIAVTSLNTTPAAILDPIIADLAPDVVLFEVKDTVAQLTSDLASFVTKINTGAGYTPDWVFLGTNQIPTAGGNDDADRIAQTAFQRNFAKSNGYSFIDLGLLFGEDIAQAQARGLHSAGADVHPTAAGYAAQVAHIFDVLAPQLQGAKYSQTRPRPLATHFPVTLANSWRANIFAGAQIRNVCLAGAGLSFTATVMGATATNGVVTLSATTGAASGEYSRATLAVAVNGFPTGTGSGTRHTIPLGFRVRLAKIIQSNTTAQIFIGAGGVDTLSGAGFGVKIATDTTAQLIAHDGSTLTTGTDFTIGAFTQELELIVASDSAGRVFAYYAIAGTAMPLAPVSTISGGPNNITAPNLHDRLMATIAVTGTPGGGGTTVQILDAQIFQGFALTP